MNEEKVKADLQKKIDDSQGQTDKITKRRGELYAEHARISASIENRAKTLGAALLEERDITRESDALTRDRVKLDNILEAFIQADQRLAELKQTEADAQRALALVDFNRLADEADSLLVSSVAKMRAAAAELAALEAKFGELHQLSAAAGVNIDHTDHLRFVRVLSHTLREGLELKLRATEEQTGARVLAEARAKKSG